MCALSGFTLDASVSDKFCEILAEEEEGNCSRYCSNCKHGARKLRIQVIAIQREHNDIKASLIKLTTQCSTNTSEISSLKTQVKDTNQKLMYCKAHLMPICQL